VGPFLLTVTDFPGILTYVSEDKTTRKEGVRKMADYFEKGFSVREPMWHGLGEVLEDYPGREVAMHKAGHDFTVMEREIYTPDMVKIQGWKELYNENTGANFNIVRDSYVVVQNDVLWDIVDAIVEEPNVKYETAGVLKSGSVLWVLAYLDEPWTAPGDDSAVYPYILVSTTHDGSGAAKAANVNIRVVCWNTWNAADSQGESTGREFTFRHTKRVMERIEEAKTALQGARENQGYFIQLANELNAMEFGDLEIRKFVEAVHPFPTADVISNRVRNNIEEARSEMYAIYNSKTIPEGIKNTGYGALQVATEYFDHKRAYRTKDSYFSRSVLKGEPRKNKIIPIIREIAEERTLVKI